MVSTCEKRIRPSVSSLGRNGVEKSGGGLLSHQPPRPPSPLSVLVAQCSMEELE